MKIDFKVKGENPRLNEPIIICGLPGSAFVGKFAVDHMISELPASLLAEVYSDGLPPQVIIKEDGIGSLFHNEIYYWKSNLPEKKDLLFYTGDAQPATPESEYALSEGVIDFLVREHGARQLITLGAYVTGSPPPGGKEPKVYAAVTDHSLVRTVSSVGCEIMSEGAITGMNGLLLGMARLKGLTGFTLLGETSGFSFEAKAPEAVLRSLSQIVGIKVSFEKLEERAKEAQEVVKALEAARNRQQGAFGPQQSSNSPTSSSNERNKVDYIS
jgi:uncharacterized protein